MARLATLAVAALAGLLLASCSGGNFGQAGLSLPTAVDGVQTVSDAADALDAHRNLASENAKAAIAVTDAFGSFVRDISADQRALALAPPHSSTHQAVHFVRQYMIEKNGKRILTGSELFMPRGVTATEYCQSSAGYSERGIPSLDETFGWESGAFSSGTRTAGERGSAIWSALASGAIVQGAIGGLTIARSGGNAACPINAPAFILKGGLSENPFEIPIAVAFERGQLTNLSVANGRFASGNSLQVTTANRQPVRVTGLISNGHTQVASFHTDATGDGTLTITSTGAQYVIADWVVVGT